MDVTKGSTSQPPIYEDFVPTSEFVADKDCDTLLIHLPGFKKEQLRVQLTRGILRISGIIPVGGNKMRRFQKEFPVSPNCETNKITARFDNGVLHVKQPKLVTPSSSSVKTEQHNVSPPPRPPTPMPPTLPQESEKPAIEPHATQNVAKKDNGDNEGKETKDGKQTCSSKNEEKSEAKTDSGRKDMVSSRKGNAVVNTRIENYEKMVRAMGQRLKMQRRVVHVVLAAVLACIVAIYVKNMVTSSIQPEN